MKSTTMHRIVALAATVAFAAACGSDASLAEKSGGPAAPLTLRLGTPEQQDAASVEYGPWVDEFVRSVEETSGGSIDVEVAWEAVPWSPESERTLATMVSDGDIDLALVPTRGGWDGLGVTSLRALQTPFLVDSVELLNTVVSSEIADEMFDSLDAFGVEGLAMWPASLRHPFAFERPLLTAADFEGAQVTYPTSETALRLFRALGVEPLAGSTTGAVDGDGVEAAFNIAPNMSALGTFTANITFYPKVDALVANADVLESLSDDQRNALRTAATDTTAYAIATNRTEADMAAQYCADGGSVALADAADLAELAKLAEPVIAWLEADDATSRIINEIRELKADTTPDPANAAAACGTVIEEVSVPTGPPSEVSELPDGVYRLETSLDDLEAAGLSNQYGDTGIRTLEVNDGTWVMSCEPLDLPGTDCGFDPNGGIVAGPLRGTGNTVWFVYDVEMISELTGCKLPTSETEPGHCVPGADSRADWLLDGDTLTFSNPFPEWASFIATEPWTRIEGADQPDTETAEFPEGVYQREFTSDELIAHGAGPDFGLWFVGVNTMIFDNGTWLLLDAGGCCPDEPGTYPIDGDGITVVHTAGYVLFKANWSLDGDQLLFTDVETNDPEERFEDFFEWFWAGPWTRVGANSASADQEEPAGSGG